MPGSLDKGLKWHSYLGKGFAQSDGQGTFLLIHGKAFSKVQGSESFRNVFFYCIIPSVKKLFKFILSSKIIQLFEGT